MNLDLGLYPIQNHLDSWTFQFCKNCVFFTPQHQKPEGSKWHKSFLNVIQCTYDLPGVRTSQVPRYWTTE